MGDVYLSFKGGKTPIKCRHLAQRGALGGFPGLESDSVLRGLILDGPSVAMHPSLHPDALRWC